ncbi:PREDICTED: protein Brevis radix-like 4 isoform X2 [Brassica oleracea var. oleracea]|uniref:protein Brevis radix-like 4 isoform X2 n=1 Tax=Brassica oleracea var. oleracea TaxID=109376 RepID=UPI0006A6EB64|nr:PREDICTED: protein Brevis radix-like 4 isoform X2 [Brassica oleracea var. oleracea]
MLTCIARSKRAGDESSGQTDDSDSKQAKSLSSQLKDMALKASGAYRHCTPCTEGQAPGPIKSTLVTTKSDPESDQRFKMLYGRSNSSITATAAAAAMQQQQPRVWGKEMEARLKGISSGEATPKSASGRNRVDPIVFVEEKEPKEWVAQVEPGVLITFVSLPGGGNDLKRIRFSRDMFNKLQAQRWWADNYDKVMELYNVQKLSRQAFPLPTPPRSQDEAKVEYHPEDTPTTPPLNKERLPRNIHHPAGLAACSSSDSLDHSSTQSRQFNDSGILNSTPKLSSISGAKTETSSITSCSSRDADRSEEMSVSNASDVDQNEWVEQDEPGVYITIKVLPCGKRELRRVRFSREIFGEMHARVWWEENRARIHEQYL